MFSGYQSITGKSRTTMRLAYIGSATSTATTATVSFNAQSIGPAFNDRTVVLIVGTFAPGGTSMFANGATINGVAMTSQVTAAGAGSDDPCVEIYTSASVVPSGTTANFVIDFSPTNTNTRIIIAVYAVGGEAGPFAYGWTAMQDGGTGLVANDSHREGGVALAAAVFKTASVTATWAGAGGLTKNADITAVTSVMSVASKVNLTCLNFTASTVTCTPSTRNNGDSLATMSFIPG